MKGRSCMSHESSTYMYERDWAKSHTEVGTCTINSSEVIFFLHNSNTCRKQEAIKECLVNSHIVRYINSFYDGKTKEFCPPPINNVEVYSNPLGALVLSSLSRPKRF